MPLSIMKSGIRAAMLLSVCLAGRTVWSEEVQLSVQDVPQPLAAAVKQLETREGWGITYEEPPGQPSPKGSILLTYTVTDATRTDSKLQEEVLTRLLARQAGKDAPRFRLVQAGGLWHITPEQGSPLETPITLPRQERPLGEVLQRLCAEVTKQSGTQVELGKTTGLRLETRVTLEAVTREPARVVLARLLNTLPQRAAWTLRTQGPERKFVLSPHRIFRLTGGTPGPAPSK
ncbi:hypothetical protein D7X96_25615 [Corallococcus interemptor]|uniref:Uncharacterized protein n=1 Tax=Corallococcus interemptor TaxID=2316720 RepID=A0A3A8Q711_9BACT|nr:hypothetical protein [Corallococcus interemptor]RKH50100.1 hypothetical protein D7Y23_14480 [Corallococcus sp. AB050B]RKH64503.1 hypothetical protein D7X96_25615 [Corallococcus interemptor]